MELFIASIPYRFYAVMALVMVFLIALTGRDFGPMLGRERKQQSESSDGEDQPSEAEHAVDPAKARWWNAAAPIAMTLAVVVALLYSTGTSGVEPGTSLSVREILGAADPSLALQYGSLAGLGFAAVLAWGQRLLTGEEILRAVAVGMKVVLPAIAILWSASSLSRMTGNRSVAGDKSEGFEFQDHRLYTGDYLTQIIRRDSSQPGAADAQASLENATTIKLMPTIVFGLAAVLSFSTGTSFGTMGLLMPMTISLTCQLLSADGASVSATDPILLACVAGVLAGAVFGDHCSPISDTTILSSQACRCDHIGHVVTQLPYAITVGLVAVVLGTLPLGWGVSVWLLIPAQVAALVGVVWLLGRKSESD